MLSRDRAPAVYSDGFTLLDLAALLARPAWMLDALCREFPDVDFFPVRGDWGKEPRAICARCLVREECAAMGIAGEEQGVWGGLTGRDRRALRTPVKIVA